MLRAIKSIKDHPYTQYVGLGLAGLIKTEVQDGSKKSKLQLIRLSAAVCGIELCYAAETAFVSPVLLKLGVPVALMTLVWCVSPILGFFLVPLMGSLSDRCPFQMGRRRPFILLMSAGIIIGLLLVPNGESLGILLGDTGDEILHGHINRNYRILLTIFGVAFLDFNCDACQSPCRAYLLDVTIPEDHSAGLTMFTVMAGIGGSIGYLMGGVDWNATEFGTAFGGHIRVVFFLVLIVFILCVLSTVTSFRELPLKELDTYGTISDPFPTTTKEKDSVLDITKNLAPSVRKASSMTEVDAQYSSQLELANPGDSESDPTIEISTDITLKTYLKSIIHMPWSMFILCLTNLFSWSSLVCYSLYFTDFVGQSVFHGNPKAPVGSDSHNRYDHGVRLGSLGMSLYSFSCALYSLGIDRLVRRFGAKNVYVYGQLAYSIGMIILAISRHKVAVILLSPSAGIMYATLFTMPYLLVAHYHTQGLFTPKETSLGDKHDKQQIRGLGTDVALVSSMVFLAQFLLSICVGSIINAVKSTVAVVAAAAILSFCGAISATQVVYLNL
ncbi:hypothetical protein LOTGIDRAFT_119222 [Lottia gigantea]|uniref:Major facilitator superfamily (MFS) profile domain-containing protein n=1 Tax=Lottia gigantea TaxID=225164 RepID=V4AEH5_LOTGI|nr:hypothetical protein LOTGIDRAFT_119222 [Lottia gigantea]ESO93540.1 hypothetical protein LOTGIDRAFT_119222 [Lottia gigantea]